MDIRGAIKLNAIFSREAAEELAEKRFPESERARVLQFFDDALAEGRRDLERHLPNIDPEHGQALLHTMGFLRPVAAVRAWIRQRGRPAPR
jgi:hypothetical protein